MVRKYWMNQSYTWSWHSIHSVQPCLQIHVKHSTISIAHRCQDINDVSQILLPALNEVDPLMFVRHFILHLCFWHALHHIINSVRQSLAQQSQLGQHWTASTHLFEKGWIHWAQKKCARREILSLKSSRKRISLYIDFLITLTLRTKFDFKKTWFWFCFKNKFFDFDFLFWKTFFDPDFDFKTSFYFDFDVA